MFIFDGAKTHMDDERRQLFRRAALQTAGGGRVELRAGLGAGDKHRLGGSAVGDPTGAPRPEIFGRRGFVK